MEVAELIPRPTLLPFSGLRGWLATFAFSFFEGLEDEVRWSIIEEVCQVNEVDMKDENDDWTVMYVRLRFRAIKML